MQLPIGAEENFEGVIDLVKMKAIYWDVESQGLNLRVPRHPGFVKDASEEGAFEFMVEAAAETSEELMNKYLEDGEISESEIIGGIRAGTVGGSIIPVFCGTAFKNKGVQAMLDAVIQLLPSPVIVRR
jgi:elongation factor G